LSDPPSKGGWGIKKYNLDDLYVRFFRIAERRIAEKTGKGIIPSSQTFPTSEIRRLSSCANGSCRN